MYTVNLWWLFNLVCLPAHEIGAISKQIQQILGNKKCQNEAIQIQYFKVYYNFQFCVKVCFLTGLNCICRARFIFPQMLTAWSMPPPMVPTYLSHLYAISMICTFGILSIRSQLCRMAMRAVHTRALELLKPAPKRNMKWNLIILITVVLCIIFIYQSNNTTNVKGMIQYRLEFYFQISTVMHDKYKRDDMLKVLGTVKEWCKLY